jgi:hypothetical protein
MAAGLLLIVLILFVTWLIPTLLALTFLRRQRLTEGALALWALVVLLVPFLGPLALWYLRPGRAQQ